MLITGSSGLLGLNLALEAARLHDVVGTVRGSLPSAPFRTIQAELAQAGELERVLDVSRAEAVINCAALADVDLCERNTALAWRINAELPERIARACAARKVRLLHISTDAVFDGEKSGSYSESDEPNPKGVYAVTKYEAEKAVILEDPLAVVARVNFYGWSLSGRRSLAEFFVNNLSQGVAVGGFTDVTFCPMLANHLGEILISMLESGMSGLYHVVGPQAMTKFQFGVAIARRFGYDENLIHTRSVEDSALAARRAHNLHLSIHKLSTAYAGPIPDFSTGLDRFFLQYRENYPQKIRSYQQASAIAEQDASDPRTNASRDRS